MNETAQKILVTGGAGGIGRWVVDELLSHGYDVSIADRHRSTRAPTRLADLCDLGQVYGVAAGHDAIVHLAGTPSPNEHPPEVVFRNNTLSTFNILEAACGLGIKKVVLAGSMSTLGLAFPFRKFNPLYLPMDEAHPLLAQDAYGMSKIMLEELGQGFARRDPSMSIISLRFCWVIAPDEIESVLRKAWSEPEFYSNELWTYVDSRDAALACRLALEVPQPGFDAMYITAEETFMREPTLELIHRYYPAIENIAPKFGGRSSVISCRHAQEVLGYKPRHTWAGTVNPETIK